MFSAVPLSLSLTGGPVGIMSLHVTIAGWSTCQWFVKARTALLGVQALVPGFTVEVIEHPAKEPYKDWWSSFKASHPKLGPKAATHGSSPAVWINDHDVRGS